VAGSPWRAGFRPAPLYKIRFGAQNGSTRGTIDADVDRANLQGGPASARTIKNAGWQPFDITQGKPALRGALSRSQFWKQIWPGSGKIGLGKINY